MIMRQPEDWRLTSRGVVLRRACALPFVRHHYSIFRYGCMVKFNSSYTNLDEAPVALGTWWINSKDVAFGDEDRGDQNRISRAAFVVYCCCRGAVEYCVQTSRYCYLITFKLHQEQEEVGVLAGIRKDPCRL